MLNYVFVQINNNTSQQEFTLLFLFSLAQCLMGTHIVIAFDINYNYTVGNEKKNI